MQHPSTTKSSGPNHDTSDSADRGMQLKQAGHLDGDVLRLNHHAAGGEHQNRIRIDGLDARRVARPDQVRQVLSLARNIQLARAAIFRPFRNAEPVGRGQLGDLTLEDMLH
jgi:hypothetical protein